MIALFTSLLLDYVCSLHSIGRAAKVFPTLGTAGNSQKNISNWKKKKERDRDPQSSINYKNPINFSLGFLPSQLLPFVVH